MKKLLMLSIIITYSCISFSQIIDSTSATLKSKYLQKSKNQKGSALVLLGGGSALIIGGNLIANNKNATFDDAGGGAVLAGVGLLSVLGSIPLFIASKKIKKGPFHQQHGLKWKQTKSHT